MKWSKIFERKTTLPLTIVNTTNINLNDDIRSQLERKRTRFKQNIITFNHNEITIPNKFITSTKASLERLMAHNNVGHTLPRLTAGIKMPDEYYLDTTQKNAFIIEKKTQQTLGSVDEKIQAAAFKQLILRKKFNSDWNVFYMFCFSDWFKQGYQEELKYFDTIGVPIFWGQDEDYHLNVLKFIKEKTKE